MQHQGSTIRYTSFDKLAEAYSPQGGSALHGILEQGSSVLSSPSFLIKSSSGAKINSAAYHDSFNDLVPQAPVRPFSRKLAPLRASTRQVAYNGSVRTPRDASTVSEPFPWPGSFSAKFSNRFSPLPAAAAAATPTAMKRSGLQQEELQLVQKFKERKALLGQLAVYEVEAARQIQAWWKGISNRSKITNELAAVFIEFDSAVLQIQIAWLKWRITKIRHFHWVTRRTHQRRRRRLLAAAGGDSPTSSSQPLSPSWSYQHRALGPGVQDPGEVDVVARVKAMLARTNVGKQTKRIKQTNAILQHLKRETQLRYLRSFLMRPILRRRLTKAKTAAEYKQSKARLDETLADMAGDRGALVAIRVLFLGWEGQAEAEAARQRKREADAARVLQRAAKRWNAQAQARKALIEQAQGRPLLGSASGAMDLRFAAWQKSRRQYLEKQRLAKQLKKAMRATQDRKRAVQYRSEYKKHLCARKVQAVYRGRIARRRCAMMGMKELYAPAAKLQAMWRGHTVRKREVARRELRRHHAALKIQAQVRGYLVRMHQSDLAKSQHKIIEAAIRIQNISLLRVRKRGLALSNFSIGANDAEPSLLTPRSLQKAGRQAAIIAELTCRLLVGLRSLEKVTVYLKNARMIVMRQGAELGFLPGFYGPPRDRKGSTASVSAGAGRRGSLSTFAVDFSQGPSVPGRRRSMHGKRRRSIVKAVAALKSEPTMHVTPEVLYKALKDNELFGDILVRIPQMVMMNLFQRVEKLIHSAMLAAANVEGEIKLFAASVGISEQSHTSYKPPHLVHFPVKIILAFQSLFRGYIARRRFREKRSKARREESLREFKPTQSPLPSDKTQALITLQRIVSVQAIARGWIERRRLQARRRDKLQVYHSQWAKASEESMLQQARLDYFLRLLARVEARALVSATENNVSDRRRIIALKKDKLRMMEMQERRNSNAGRLQALSIGGKR